jgi:hypothetical protein
MTLHLIKLAVGADNIEDMTSWQAARLKKAGELLHVTRMVPKRADALLPKGSIYWVIKGMIRLRQRLVEIRPVQGQDGVARCALVLDPKLVPVRPTPRRAFQGWRYLTAADAPRDLPKGARARDMPEGLHETLNELGLL